MTASISTIPPKSYQKEDILTQWVVISSLQKRFFQTLDTEVVETSKIVEDSAIGLSDQFRGLGELAMEQSRRISEMVDNSQNVAHEGETTDYEKILNDMDIVLTQMVGSIILFSKEAMRLVFALESVNKDVFEMSKALGDIDKLNRQTQYLAINAAIEANSSKTNQQDNSFDIIANEIRDLSNNTSRLADYVKNRMIGVTNGISGTYETLRKIAETDLDPQIEAKEKIEAALNSILKHSQKQSGVMKDALNTNEKIGNMVGKLTMTMQFQDFSKQKLEQVSEALNFLDKMSEQINGDTLCHLQITDLKDLETEEKNIVNIAEGFLEECSLSDVKQKFLLNILSDQSAQISDNAYSNKDEEITELEDDIELF